MKFSADYPVWEIQPRGLTIDEVNDPYQVFDDFFDYAGLIERRQMLWQWLETTVTDTFAARSDKKEREWITSSYRDLRKLMEAVYLIHEVHQAQTSKASTETADL